MGDFSWCYCDTGSIKTGPCGLEPRKEQRLIMGHPASVLFPKEFGGKEKQIDEPDYYGYGMFKGQDIYDLVADWNREWISEHPDWVPPYREKYHKRYPENGPAEAISQESFFPFYADLSLSKDEMMAEWRKWYKENGGRGWPPTEYRSIGITIACYDEDNAALPFPIKIAKNKDSVYEHCPPSLSDPYQGWDE